MPLTHGQNGPIQPVLDLAFREQRRKRTQDIWDRKQRMRNNAVVVFKPHEYLVPPGNTDPLFMGAPQTPTDTSARWMALPKQNSDFGSVVPPSQSGLHSKNSPALHPISEMPFGPFPESKQSPSHRTKTESCHSPGSPRHASPHPVSPRHVDSVSSPKASARSPRKPVARHSCPYCRCGLEGETNDRESESSPRPNDIRDTRPRICADRLETDTAPKRRHPEYDNLPSPHIRKVLVKGPHTPVDVLTRCSRNESAYDKPNVGLIDGRTSTGSRAHGRGANTWITSNGAYGRCM